VHASEGQHGLHLGTYAAWLFRAVGILRSSHGSLSPCPRRQAVTIARVVERHRVSGDRLPRRFAACHRSTGSRYAVKRRHARAVRGTAHSVAAESQAGRKFDLHRAGAVSDGELMQRRWQMVVEESFQLTGQGAVVFGEFYGATRPGDRAVIRIGNSRTIVKHVGFEIADGVDSTGQRHSRLALVLHGQPVDAVPIGAVVESED